jgi:hypothetical protein
LTSSKKIQLIEDEPEIAALISVELVDRGYEVIVSHTGQDGFVSILKNLPALTCMPFIFTTAEPLHVITYFHDPKQYNRLEKLRFGPLPLCRTSNIAVAYCSIDIRPLENRLTESVFYSNSKVRSWDGSNQILPMVHRAGRLSLSQFRFAR